MTDQIHFKLAELKDAKDGEPKVVSYTIEEFVRKVSKNIDSPTPYKAYHHQKAEEKRLATEARVAYSLGQVEHAKELKAEAKLYKSYVSKTKMGPAWMPFIFKDDLTYKQVTDGWKQRDNDRITHFSMIMLDIESQITKDEIHSALSEYEYVLWPTITHKPEDPRFRVVLFPAKPLTTKAAQDLIYRVDALLPARNDLSKKTQAIDPASLDVGRLMYRPKWLHAHPEVYFYKHNRGKLLTPNSFKLTTAQQEALAARRAEAEKHHTQTQAAAIKRLTANPTASSAIVINGGKTWLNPDGHLETDNGWELISAITTKISGVKCPVHVDSVGSEFVAPNQHTNRPQLVCAKCGVFKMLPIDREADDSDEVESKLIFKRREGGAPPPVPPAKKPKKPTTPEVTLFETDHILRLTERYLPSDLIKAIPDKGLMVVRSPKGTGKTELIRTLTAQCAKNDQTVMLLGHRVFLLQNLAVRTNLDYYKDLPDGGKTDAMTLCMNSLTRIDPATDKPYHTLIIDESEQVFQALIGSNLKSELAKVFTNLIWLFRNATRIVCLDADLSAELTIELIGELRGTDPSFETRGVINDYPIGKGQTTKLYENNFHMLFDALDAIAQGEKVFIALNRNEEAAYIAGIINAMGKKTLLVTASTNELPESIAFVRNPTAESVTYDAVVTSPTLSTGISIEGDHFTRVFGFFYLKPGTYQDADQAISRVRNCTNISAWIQGNKTKPILTSEESIYDKSLDIERLSFKRIFGETPRMTQGQLMWARIYSRIQYMLNEWSVNKDEKFTTLREELGYEVEKVLNDKERSASARATFREYKHVKVDMAEEIVAATEIDPEYAAELGRKRIRTHKEELQLKRYRLEAVLKEDFNLENVRKANEQELLLSLAKIRNLVIRGIDGNVADDRADRERNKDAFTANRNRAMQHDLIQLMSKQAAIDVEALYRRAASGEEVEISTDVMKTVADAYASRPRDFNFYFNSRIKDPSNPSNHMKVWNATFGDHMRLTLEKKKRGSANNRVSRYFIAIAKNDLVLKVASEEIDRSAAMGLKLKVKRK